MANRAAQLRAAILARDPGAVVAARGRTWIRHQLSSGDFALDTVIGPLHLDDGTEIDTAIVNSTDANYDDESTTTPYRVRQRNGVRRFWPRRDVLTEFVDFGAPEFRRPNNTWAVIPWDSKTRSDNVITFTRNADGSQLQIVLGPTRLKLNFILANAPSVTNWRFPLSATGLTRQGQDLIAASDGTVVARLAPFSLVDAAGVERGITGQFTAHPTYQGAYQIAPDLSGLTYPVVIDPTVDVNPSADADDGFWTSTGTFSNNGTTTSFGDSGGTKLHTFLRFAVAVDAAATINVAYFAVVAGQTQSGTTCNGTISAEAADNPAVVTTAADANGRTTTTATAAWSSIATWTLNDNIQSPSIVSVEQELVNRAGWASGQAQQWFIKDNGSSASARRNFACREHATLTEATLHIEYTAAAGGKPWYAYAQQ